MPDKAQRVANFHRETVKSFFEVLGATGFQNPRDLKPWHIMRRIGPMDSRNYSEIYPFIDPGSLLGKDLPPSFARPWEQADPKSFH